MSDDNSTGGPFWGQMIFCQTCQLTHPFGTPCGTQPPWVQPPQPPIRPVTDADVQLETLDRIAEALEDLARQCHPKVDVPRIVERLVEDLRNRGNFAQAMRDLDENDYVARSSFAHLRCTWQNIIEEGLRGERD